MLEIKKANARRVKRYMRDDSRPREIHPDELDSPTLFPYRITSSGLMVNVDFKFFQDFNLGPRDYVHIEATTEGIELTPIKGDRDRNGTPPYRVKRS